MLAAGTGSTKYAIRRQDGQPWTEGEKEALGRDGHAVSIYPANDRSAVYVSGQPEASAVAALLGHDRFTIQPTLLP